MSGKIQSKQTNSLGVAGKTPETSVEALQRIRDELATALAKDKIAAMRAGGAA